MEFAGVDFKIQALRKGVRPDPFMRTRPLAFELLPKQFALTQLQNLYEQVFDITLDKRNFRKKAAKRPFIKPTEKKTEGEKHRPALLYEYDAKSYETFTRESFF